MIVIYNLGSEITARTNDNNVQFRISGSEIMTLQKNNKAFNSILARKDADIETEPNGKTVIKGSYVFSYCWDYKAGGFPQMLQLIKMTDFVINGFSSSKEDAPESREHLIAQQQNYFGDKQGLVDVNKMFFNGDLINTRDIFKFFIEHGLIKKSSVLSAGRVNYLTSN